VVLPIITYLTSIRPTYEATKAASEVIDGLQNRFGEMIAKYRDDQVSKAIVNLAHPDGGIRRAAIVHLGLDPHYPSEVVLVWYTGNTEALAGRMRR